MSLLEAASRAYGRVDDDACVVPNLFSGCEEAAAAALKELEVVSFLNVPELVGCDKDPGLSRVIVGLLRLEREVVGLSIPDRCEETVAVEVLRAELELVGAVMRDDEAVLRSGFSVDVAARKELVVLRSVLSVLPMALEDVVVLLSDFSGGALARDEVRALRSDLSAAPAGCEEAVVLRLFVSDA